MHYFLGLILLLYCNIALGQVGFEDLNKAIRQAGEFDRAKENRIRNLKQTIRESNESALYEGYSKLFTEYSIFHYDSAFGYAQKALTQAIKLNNGELINCSRIKLSFILLSAGLFKEAYDSLQAIPATNLEGKCKVEYYTLLARYYYDLADYTMDSYHSPRYNKKGNAYLDSALHYLGDDFEGLYYRGLRNIRGGKIEAAETYLMNLMVRPGLTLHQQALAASTMSDIYIQRGQTDSAIQLLVLAAIADIQSSTKETSAIFNLANLLFKKGDLKNASTYIEKAVKDAVSYGARQRKVQMSAILPLIEGERIARVESEKRSLTVYAVIVTLLLVLLVYLTLIIARQIKKLKAAQKIIIHAHQEQQKMSEKLVEANKIKEEYIGFFFNANTAFFDKMDRFKRKAERKAEEQKLEEVLYLIKKLNISEERNELLKNFDAMFLKIFPHFIEAYNALFKPEDRTPVKEDEILNTELRIFALIRLGIRDNDKIAAILGYSLNTINAYKTKYKNRSLVSNEQFEERIMEIKSV